MTDTVVIIDCLSDQVAALDGRASAFTAPMQGIQRMGTQRTAATPTALRMQSPVTEDQEIVNAKAEMTTLSVGSQFEAKGQVQDTPLVLDSYST